MVYIQNALGQPLMPTKDHRKVRLLLQTRKAVVVKKSPFTIRLKVRTKQYVQPITLGIDAGSKHVGVSACAEKEELFCAEMRPRNDVVKNLSVDVGIAQLGTALRGSITVCTVSTKVGWHRR